MQGVGYPVRHFGSAARLGQEAELIALVVSDNRRIRTHTALNQGSVEPFAAAVFRDAVQLFAGIFTVEIADFLAPRGFAVCRPLFAQAQANAAVEAV